MRNGDRILQHFQTITPFGDSTPARGVVLIRRIDVGPDSLAQELGWFSQGAGAQRSRSTRELRAHLDFEDDWEDDLDEKVAEITSEYEADGDFDDLEDEELLETADYGEDSDEEN